MTTIHDWDQDERDALAGFGDELAALRRRHDGDPTADLLRAARDQVLPDDLQARVTQRLARSAWSRALADGLDDLTPALSDGDADRLLHRVHDAAVRRAADNGGAALGWRQMFAFAGLAAVVLLMVTVPRWRAAVPFTGPAPGLAPSAAATPGPGATGPGTSASAVPAAPATPAFVLALGKPDLRLSLAALRFRGSAGDNQLISDLKPGFDALQRDDFAGAVRALAPLRPRYPAAIEVSFYLGVARLLAGDTAGAREALRAAAGIADEAFAADVAWYQAVADERGGDRAAARRRLAALCKAGGTRAAEACDAATRLQ